MRLEVTGPRFVPLGHYRKNHVLCGRTKAWALVKAGKIVMVDVGVGQRMVDVEASLRAMTQRERDVLNQEAA